MTCTAKRHGTITALMLDGCSCPEAIEDRNRRMRRARKMRQSGRPLRVPIVGVRRRIQALMAIGWPRPEIARRIGWQGGSLGDLANPRRSQVDRRTYLAVRAVYDELADKPGPSARTKGWARNRGYLPPLAWDDDLIDDPTYDPLHIGEHAPAVSVAAPLMPLEVAVADGIAFTRGRPRPAEFIHAAERLERASREQGVTVEAVAEQIGVSMRAIERLKNDARQVLAEASA